MNCTEFRELHAAAAMRALDPLEVEQVEQHLALCAACREEVAGWERLGTLLALTVPQVEPSPALRERILAVVRCEAASVVTAGPRWRWPRLAPARLAVGGLAAALTLAVALGAWGYSLSNELETQRQLNASLTQGLQGREDLVQLVSSQPELRSILNGTPEAPTARGRVYTASFSDMALILVDGLKPLGPDRVYQVWLMQAGTPVNGGTFTVDGLGQGRWLIRAPEPLNRYQAIVVTEEPAGGSAAPTSPRVLSGLF
ncbi:MAG: anti-sigma factor [Chloroflexi bacterium]|nr:anti-sigma factor [Chloroflexota bacterium]